MKPSLDQMGIAAFALQTAAEKSSKPPRSFFYYSTAGRFLTALCQKLTNRTIALAQISVSSEY
jgi:hypothetical protein